MSQGSSGYYIEFQPPLPPKYLDSNSCFKGGLISTTLFTQSLLDIEAEYVDCLLAICSISTLIWIWWNIYLAYLVSFSFSLFLSFIAAILFLPNNQLIASSKHLLLLCPFAFNESAPQQPLSQTRTGNQLATTESGDTKNLKVTIYDDILLDKSQIRVYWRFHCFVLWFERPPCSALAPLDTGKPKSR